MTVEDVCRVVGEKFYAKDVRVIYLEYCTRRYGSRSNTKEVFGIVLGVVTNKASLKCNHCFILVGYDLYVRTKKSN